MSTTIGDLMHANLLEVFNERDPDRRRAAIARTYTDDVAFHDAEGVITGPSAMNDKVQHLLDDAPGFVFRPEGPLREVDDLGMQAWGFGPEGQPPVVAGIDVALVHDGRITSVHTVLTSTPSAG